MRRSRVHRRRLLTGFSTGVIATIAGCTGLFGSTASDEELKSTVRTLATAYRTDDLDLLRSAVHPDSSQFSDVSREDIESASLSVETLDVATKESDRAVVLADLEIADENGETRSDRYTFELQPHDGEWLIWAFRPTR